jgi:tryptophan synthase beta chain
MKGDTKILLSEREMPTRWYNLAADLPGHRPPMLSPITKQPLTPPDLAPIFCDELIMQEVSQERYIDIPEEVQDIYRLWRPSPLYRAYRLEKVLDTPAKIYYKYEGVSPAGSHKPNTAIAQAYYNKKAGVRRIATETGAGQWGSALALACNYFGIECKVYMVKVSYQQKPYRRHLMEAWGATCIASPSTETAAGRAILAKDSNSPGSLGIAISEAVEDAATHDDTKYSLGSVVNHVCMHQTVIGEEAMLQIAKVGDYPDVVIGCVGGGSNFAGISFPFVRENLKAGKKTRFIAVEPSACPSMTKGVYAYDYGDTVGMGPIAKMDTLGHNFIPSGIHAGGLRYHGMSPLVSELHQMGIVEPVAYRQTDVFAAAIQFARSEGIIPAPESSHAIKAAIDEATRAKEVGEAPVILFNLSGHGHFDMAAYDNYLSGKLVDYEYPAAEVARALEELPQVQF